MNTIRTTSPLSTPLRILGGTLVVVALMATPASAQDFSNCPDFIQGFFTQMQDGRVVGVCCTSTGTCFNAFERTCINTYQGDFTETHDMTCEPGPDRNIVCRPHVAGSAFPGGFAIQPGGQAVSTFGLGTFDAGSCSGSGTWDDGTSNTGTWQFGDGVVSAVSCEDNTTMNWDNGGDGRSYDDALNWEVGRVPDKDDTVSFSIGGFSNNLDEYRYTIEFSEDVTNDSLVNVFDNITLELAGHRYTLAGNCFDGPAVDIGGTGNLPTLSINDGRIVCDGNLHLATQKDENGILYVETDGILEIDGSVVVGHPDAGLETLLRVSGNTTVAGALELIGGSCEVQGPSAALSATGTVHTITSAFDPALKIEAGGTFEADGLLIISAGQPDETTRAAVSGSGTFWDQSINSTLTVGAIGTAVLDMSDGADATCWDVIIPDGDGDGRVNVSGEGTLWTIQGNLEIGSFVNSAGSIILRDGARLETTDAVLGSAAGATGAVDVGEDCAWINTGTIEAGSNGDAVINNSGRIESGTICVGAGGNLLGNEVVVTGPNSTNQRAANGSASVIVTTALAVEQGGRLSVDRVTFLPGGHIGGSGQFQFDMINAGTVAPGNNAQHGTFDVVGDYEQRSMATLDIQIGPINHDALRVAGRAELDGMLSIRLSNDFVPQLDERFEILTATSVSGAFAVVDNDASEQGVGFDVRYGSSSVELVVISVPEVLSPRSMTGACGSGFASLGLTGLLVMSGASRINGRPVSRSRQEPIAYHL